jgi:uracil-DNA glycosylase family 4
VPSPDAALAGDLVSLRDRIVECRACPRLVEWRDWVALERRAAFREQRYWARPVPGFGDPAAKLLVVGLAPAAHGGNRTGRVFTGDRSGDWLYRALWRAGFANQPTSTSADDGLVLTGAYVAAAVRCAPPANRPTPAERDRCLPYLARELELLPGVVVVVALGQFAHDAVASLLGLRPRPRFGHLAEAPLPGARILLDSYHPSQQNTFTGKLAEDAFDAVFARARQLALGQDSAPAVSPTA